MHYFGVAWSFERTVHAYMYRTSNSSKCDDESANKADGVRSCQRAHQSKEKGEWLAYTQKIRACTDI